MGKSSLISALIGEEFTDYGQRTNGIIYNFLTYKYKNKIYQHQICDTCSRNWAISKIFIEMSDIIIIVLDLSQRYNLYCDLDSIDFNDFKEKLIYLVGNKLDLTDESSSYYSNYLKHLIKFGIKYFEVSCKTKVGIDLLKKNLAYDFAIFNEAGKNKKNISN